MRIELNGLINTLGEEKFRVLVQEYTKSKYKTKEVRIVDGPYDGGNDLEIYVNGKEIKKNIQITVQKDNFETKLIKDLEKAQKNVSKYGYLRILEFYSSQNISKEKRNELENRSEIDYDINLRIHDSNFLSQAVDENIELKKILYRLHEIDDNSNKYFDKNTKLIFDVLTHNKNTVEIKKNFISAHIYSFLLNNLNSNQDDIIEYLLEIFDNRLDKDFIKKEIDYLKIKQFIFQDKESKILNLSEIKRKEIESINSVVSDQENILLKKIEVFIKKNNLTIDINELIQLIYKIYKDNYNVDVEEIKESYSTYSTSLKKSFSDLVSYLQSKGEVENSYGLANQLIEICSSNDFLTKYSTVHLFNNLFSSNKLEEYLSTKEQVILLDTQILLRIICVIYPCNYSFKDSALNSVDLFHKTIKKLDAQISLQTTVDYIKEVAIHLSNAIKLKRFMELPFFEQLGNTKNVFYNAYLEFRDNKIIDVSLSFTDFVEDLLGINPGELEISDENELKNFIFSKVRNLCDYMGINIVSHGLYTNFEIIKREYEIDLTSNSRNRAYNAIQNDLRTIIYLSTKDLHLDENGIFQEPYLVTWDSSFYSVRTLLTDPKKNLNCSFWYIYSPIKLIDRLSVMNFNLNPQTLSLNIIAITENNFNYSTKNASFIDVISSFFNSQELSELGIIKKLSQLNAESQSLNIDNQNAKEFSENEVESPILSALMNLRNYYGSSETEYNLNKLIKVFENKELEQKIIKILSDYLTYKKDTNMHNEFDTLLKLIE